MTDEELRAKEEKKWINKKIEEIDGHISDLIEEINNLDQNKPIKDLIGKIKNLVQEIKNRECLEKKL